jgi:alanine-glyoxylate transaminase/serine-glyoxylate transaminase/serine-pyruvate transaminase
MAGLDQLGLKPFAQEGHRLWQLNAVWVPEGINDLEVRTQLLRKYNIEIGAAWATTRANLAHRHHGLFGAGVQYLNLLSALEDILEDLATSWKTAKRVMPPKPFMPSTKKVCRRARSNGGQGETIGAETVRRGIAHHD